MNKKLIKNINKVNLFYGFFLIILVQFYNFLTLNSFLISFLYLTFLFDLFLTAFLQYKKFNSKIGFIYLIYFILVPLIKSLLLLIYLNLIKLFILADYIYLIIEVIFTIFVPLIILFVIFFIIYKKSKSIELNENFSAFKGIYINKNYNKNSDFKLLIFKSLYFLNIFLFYIITIFLDAKYCDNLALITYFPLLFLLISSLLSFINIYLSIKNSFLNKVFTYFYYLSYTFYILIYLIYFYLKVFNGLEIEYLYLEGTFILIALYELISYMIKFNADLINSCFNIKRKNNI